ncbi:MAG: phage protein GemA/Gp16 family protein, partial [Eubacterium sp.]
LKVIRRLEALPKKPRKKKAVKEPFEGAQPGMMGKGVQAKAWALIYQLIEYDEKDKVQSKGTAGERMAGAIRKILRMDVDVSDPFRWVDEQQAWLLIEQLKRYVASREAISKKREKGA